MTAPIPNPPTSEDIARMTLLNLDKDSVLLGFLRNPKVTSLPELVARIVEHRRSLTAL